MKLKRQQHSILTYRIAHLLFSSTRPQSKSKWVRLVLQGLCSKEPSRNDVTLGLLNKADSPPFRITFLHFLAKKSDVISGRPLIGTRKNVVESHSPTLNFRFKRFFRKATNANKKYRIVAPYLLQYTAKQLYMCVFLGDDVTILAYVKGYILSPKPLHLD